MMESLVLYSEKQRQYKTLQNHIQALADRGTLYYMRFPSRLYCDYPSCDVFFFRRIKKVLRRL